MLWRLRILVDDWIDWIDWIDTFRSILVLAIVYLSLSLFWSSIHLLKSRFKNIRLFNSRAVQFKFNWNEECDTLNTHTCTYISNWEITLFDTWGFYQPALRSKAGKACVILSKGGVCLLVCLWWRGGLTNCLARYTPLLTRHTTPWLGTPTPFGQTHHPHAPSQTHPHMQRYSQAPVGMHPTRMHSCYIMWLLRPEYDLCNCKSRGWEADFEAPKLRIITPCFIFLCSFFAPLCLEFYFFYILLLFTIQISASLQHIISQLIKIKSRRFSSWSSFHII